MMVLFGNGGIPTTFRYKLFGFSVKGQAKSQIRDSYGNSKLVTATSGQSPPTPSNISSQHQQNTV